MELFKRLKIAKMLLKEIKTCSECGRPTLRVGLNTGYRHELFPYMEYIDFPCSKCPRCMEICYNKHKLFCSDRPNIQYGWGLQVADEMECIQNREDLDDFLEDGYFEEGLRDYINCWIYHERKDYMDIDHYYENDIVDLLEIFNIKD